MDKQKKIIISHPTGNENTRGAVYGFYKMGILDSFHTCIACFKKSIFYRLSVGPFKKIRRREYWYSIRPYTYTYPLKELCRLIASMLHINKWITHETGKYCIDKIYHDLDEKVGIFLTRHQSDIDAVYAYEDGALETFRMAHELHKICIYDLPIGYWRAMRSLLNEERGKNPEWAMTLGGFNDSEEKLRRKDEELRLADKIYVASTFTKKTLEMYPGKLSDIEIIPYGFPPINKQREYDGIRGRKIRALFVGGLSQRKGISYLFEAVKGLNDNIELTIVGRGDIDGCNALKNALKNVNYIPSLPHDAVLNLMSENDVFIFPSLFEGFGLVITEAMAQGTPVITTDRTCGPDIITDGEDGWIVEAGKAQPIRDLLEKFINNPEILCEVGRAAMNTANKRPWSCYETELAQSVKTFINGKLS